MIKIINVLQRSNNYISLLQFELWKDIFDKKHFFGEGKHLHRNEVENIGA